MFKRLRADVRAAKQNDPAARSKLEILLTYSGVKALAWHRFANFLYRITMRFHLCIPARTNHNSVKEEDIS
jgi:serine O-acetyltransferase